MRLLYIPSETLYFVATVEIVQSQGGGRTPTSIKRSYTSELVGTDLLHLHVSAHSSGICVVWSVPSPTRKKPRSHIHCGGVGRVFFLSLFFFEIPAPSAIKTCHVLFAFGLGMSFFRGRMRGLLIFTL